MTASRQEPRLEPVCPYCGSDEWSPAFGSDHGLKLSGVILSEYDEHGRVSADPGIEVAAFSCMGCGYIRFHDPRFLPKRL